MLDVATCFGFFPLLLERVRAMTGTLGEIAGCDLNPALMGFANAYARHAGLAEVQFGIADILAADLERELAPLPARYDVVTALHLLEHLEPAQTEQAIAHLWRLTARRLIIAVPLETVPDPRYGHQQVFDRDRLLTSGGRSAAIVTISRFTAAGWSLTGLIAPPEKTGDAPAIRQEPPHHRRNSPCCTQLPVKPVPKSASKPAITTSSAANGSRR